MKAVILARVSTREQEEGHSIDAQIMRLRKYCERKELDIIKEFVFVESSTRGDRPEFYKMIDFIKQQKEKIALVCDKVDRLQRSFKEVPILENLRRSGKLVLHFNVEGQILDENANSSQIMAYQMFVMMAENYTNCISDNVRRSFEKKLQEGTILGTAPIGYLNTKDVNNKTDVILDSQRAFLVKKMFEEYATGLYSLNEIRKKTIEWGLKNKTKSQTYLSVSQIDKTLRNPFYYGIMKHKNTLYPHIYKPLLSKELFWTCEKVREGRSKAYSNSTKVEYIFKGLIKCKNCGCAVTPETKKGKYVYLRPNSKQGCNCKQIKEEQALETVTAVLKSMTMPESLVSETKSLLRNGLEAKKDFNTNSVKALQKNYNETQKKLDVLLEIRLEQSITKDEYDKKSNALRAELYNIENKMRNHTTADKEFAITLEYLLDLA
jgi:site-specific DNA recombinase